MGAVYDGGHGEASVYKQRGGPVLQWGRTNKVGRGGKPLRWRLLWCVEKRCKRRDPQHACGEMEVSKGTGKVYERFPAGEKRGGLVGAGLSSRFSRSRIDAHIFLQHFEKVRARWLGTRFG